MAEFPEQSPVSRIWSELKRRRVIRVIVLYAIAGWIVIEVASTVLPNLNLPEWTVTLVTALVVLGFIIAIMLAWAFDIGPGGVHRTASLGDPVGAVTTAEQPAMSAVPQNPAKKPTTDDESRRAIAVLPFVNMSGDPENE